MIRVGVVGLGYWGPNLARNFAAIPGCELAWCCDASERPARAGRRRSRPPASPRDLDDLLDDHDARRDRARHAGADPRPAGRARAARRQALLRREAARLHGRGRRAGGRRGRSAADRILMVGHLLVYHPGVDKLKAIADSGELGDIHYIYSHRLNLGKLRSDENALWSLGAHDISVVLHLAGEDPDTVEARGEAYTRAGVEDVVFSFLRFPSGVAAHLHMSWLDPHKTRSFTVVGSQADGDVRRHGARAQGHRLRQGLRRGHPLLRRVHHPLGRHPQPADRQPRAAADRVRALRRVHPRGHASRARTARRACASCASWPRCRRTWTRPARLGL